MASLIFTFDETVVTGVGFGSGTGSADSVPESWDSHWPAIFFASTQSETSVDLRENFSLTVPDAKIGQSHRFQPFLRSSNSPEQELCSCPALQARRCRR